VLVEHDDSDRAGMVEVLAGDDPGVTEVDVVLHEVEDPALVDGGATHDPSRRDTVLDALLVRPSCRHAVAPWRTSAAATRPWNSGCDRVGRDLNSGCACVLT